MSACGNFYPASPCQTTVIHVPPATTAATGGDITGAVGIGASIAFLGVLAIALARANMKRRSS